MSSSRSFAMNANPIGSGGKGGSHDSGIILVFVLGIGYAVGASTIGRRTWNLLLVLEEWVRDVVIPCYTLSAFLYVLIQNFDESISSALSLLSTSKTAPKEPVEEEEEEEDQGEKPIDMNGTFKVVENDNFAEFLKAQGVPGFLCNAASKARPTHEFTHSSVKRLTIRIRGIIESETSYEINGPFTETTIRGRLFQDSLSYLYDESGPDKLCCGVQTRKVAMGQGYVVQVQRRVIRAGSVWNPTPEENPDGHNIYDLDTASEIDRLIMTNKVVYDNGDEPVIASQLFHRMD